MRAKFCHFPANLQIEVEKMNRQNGFSLIELLLVVVIIGIIATITFPLLYSAKQSAENGNAYASLRSISSSQISYFSQNSRFARLDELNTAQSSALGIISGNDLTRGRFTFRMNPVAPTDAELRDGYTVIATKGVTGSENPYVISLDQSGFITCVFGTCTNY